MKHKYETFECATNNGFLNEGIHVHYIVFVDKKSRANGDNL